MTMCSSTEEWMEPCQTEWLEKTVKLRLRMAKTLPCKVGKSIPGQGNSMYKVSKAWKKACIARACKQRWNLCRFSSECFLKVQNPLKCLLVVLVSLQTRWPNISDIYSLMVVVARCPKSRAHDPSKGSRGKSPLASSSFGWLLAFLGLWPHLPVCSVLTVTSALCI